jgi:hypothetical protein
MRNRPEACATMPTPSRTSASLPSQSNASPAAGAARYNVARLMEKYGDAKLRHVLANCPKARSQSIHDRCKVRDGEDSRLS